MPRKPFVYMQVSDRRRKRQMYRLVCPECGQIDPTPIDSQILLDLYSDGSSSLCINCDPEGGQQIPYVPAQPEFALRRLHPEAR